MTQCIEERKKRLKDKITSLIDSQPKAVSSCKCNQQNNIRPPVFDRVAIALPEFMSERDGHGQSRER
jgi:hypothetical protein